MGSLLSEVLLGLGFAATRGFLESHGDFEFDLGDVYVVFLLKPAFYNFQEILFGDARVIVSRIRFGLRQTELNSFHRFLRNIRELRRCLLAAGCSHSSCLLYRGSCRAFRLG